MGHNRVVGVDMLYAGISMVKGCNGFSLHTNTKARHRYLLMIAVSADVGV